MQATRLIPIGFIAVTALAMSGCSKSPPATQTKAEAKPAESPAQPARAPEQFDASKYLPLTLHAIGMNSDPTLIPLNLVYHAIHPQTDFTPDDILNSAYGTSWQSRNPFDEKANKEKAIAILNEKLPSIGDHRKFYAGVTRFDDATQKLRGSINEPFDLNSKTYKIANCTAHVHGSADRYTVALNQMNEPAAFNCEAKVDDLALAEYIEKNRQQSIAISNAAKFFTVKNTAYDKERGRRSMNVNVDAIWFIYKVGEKNIILEVRDKQAPTLREATEKDLKV